MDPTTYNPALVLLDVLDQAVLPNLELDRERFADAIQFCEEENA